MSSLDLKGIKRGDLVEYQRPSHTNTACGAFQGWYSTDDGQVRLIVRNLELGMDILGPIFRTPHCCGERFRARID